MALEPITRQEKIIAGQDLTPITRMEKFLKEYGGGASSWNDLKDKPFGEETSEAVALEEQELTFSTLDAANDDTVVMANVLLTSAPSAGDKVKVKWDGVDYVCEAQEDGTIAFGNFGLIHGEASDEPFVFIDEGGWICACKGANGDIHTVSVSISSETTKTLDPKYLPEHLQFGEGWLVPETTVEGFTLMEGTLYAVENPFSLTLTVGATYVVNWDGAEYELVCNVIEEAHLTYIGNANYADIVSGGDIPFAVILEPESGTLFVVTESTANSHTISVKGVKTIAKKYMPPMTRLYKGGNFGGDIGYLYEDILRQIPLDFLDFRNRFLNGERFYCVVEDFMGSKNVFVNILSFYANAEDNFGTASGSFSGQSMAFNLVKEEGVI